MGSLRRKISKEQMERALKPAYFSQFVKKKVFSKDFIIIRENAACSRAGDRVNYERKLKRI